MQPQVPLVTSAGEPTGKTVPKGSTVLPKPEAITQKAPSIEEQIQDADKRIVDLTKTLGSTGWKTKDAKEALIKEIDAQKAHKESLLNKVGQKPQPITMRNKKTGEVKVFKSIEEANAFMGK
jgi:Skp family chaperone for outer membrane proteins